MKVKINPSIARGFVHAPPSKSVAHRLLICAGLAEGQSEINNIDLSEDISATLDCLKTLGAKWEYIDRSILITGINITKASPSGVLNCRESGSTLRFFIPIALATGKEITLTGTERLFERPLDVYQKIADQHNLIFDQRKNQVTVKGPLPSGEYSIPGDISSQFVTGLLFALPLLNGDSSLIIEPPIESMSYIGLTTEALKSFGIKISNSVEVKDGDDYFSNKNSLFRNMQETELNFKITGNQNYQACKKNVEGDYSNAAFLEAFNIFDGDVKILGLKPNTTQGDAVYEDLFHQITRAGFLNEKISIEDCPDLGPILFAVAAATGGGYFTGTKRLAIKESNRAEAMKQELAKFGTKVTIEENSVKITPEVFHKPKETLYGHNDHRIVMSLAVLCSIVGGEIEGAEAVNKSYPDFFETIKKLGIDVEIID